MNIQSSFTVYTAALHALILNYLLLAYYWLGLSWIDLALLYFNKQRLFIIQNKQQEKQKHSAENTINFSGSRGSLSLCTGSDPAPYNQCSEQANISRRAD